MPSTPYQTVETKFGAGLNLVDSPEALEDQEATILENFRFSGRGRLTTRRAVKTLTSGFTGSVIGTFPFSHLAGVGAVVLTHDTVNSVVKLYTLDGNGLNLVDRGNLAGWSSVTTKPKVLASSLHRALFIVDEAKSHGLTVYDPNNVLGGGTFFQPQFDFDADFTLPSTGDKGPIKGRVVATYNNMVFVAGYGSEQTSESDRPETVRFSFLGLADDAQGAGDAGKDSGGAEIVTGGSGLFDRGDYFQVGRMHTPVVGMVPGAGRLIITTPYEAYALFGHDRDSFQLEQIDNERGCLATRAMVEADGVAYWMSPLGPCRFNGRVEDMARKVLPRVSEIDTASLFAVHARDSQEVQWYWNDGATSRALCYNYRTETWTERVFGVQFYCGGFVQPSGSPGPAGAPTSLTHSVTSASAVASWTPGDTSPGCKTKVYLAPNVVGTPDTPGTYVLQAELDSTTSSYTHSGLSASTSYWTKVEHWRNGTNLLSDGVTVAKAEAKFTTNASGYVAPPEDFTATDSPVWDSKYNRYNPSVLTSWVLGQDSVYTEIHRSTTSGFTPSGSTVIKLTELDVSSYRDNNVVADTTYYYVARHKDTSGNFSTYTSQVSVTPTTSGN